ncbi:MAG TPA: lysophospholipase, partial [Chitinophagaceae bacterium]|nr:lysophospholipase [Chitinophagaceae bacterium]
MNNHKGRRAFIKKAALGSALAVCIPGIVSAALAAEKMKKVSLGKNDVVLFQGDSITDFHRKRSDNSANSPEAMGIGYATHAATDMLFQYPEQQLKIYNRGVSGNKVFQLADR